MGIAEAGLIERLGNKKAKGMKQTKGNGINGLQGGLFAGLCRLLAGFRPELKLPKWAIKYGWSRK